MCAELNPHLKPQTHRYIMKVPDSLLALVHDTDSYMLAGGPLDEIRHRLHFIRQSRVWRGCEWGLTFRLLQSEDILTDPLRIYLEMRFRSDFEFGLGEVWCNAGIRLARYSD